MTLAVFKLSQDLGDASGALWGKLIKVQHKKLQKTLRDYTQGTVTCCWPSLGTLLLFRLVSLVFSVTDRKHVVVEATFLYLSQALSQCAINNLADLASGILCVGILLDMTQESKRMVPEIVTFLGSFYHLFVTESSTTTITTSSTSSSLHSVTASDSCQKTFNVTKLSWLRDSLHAYDPNSTSATTNALSSNSMISWEVFGSTETPSSVTTSSVASHVYSLFSTSLSMTNQLVDNFKQLSSFHELFQDSLVLPLLDIQYLQQRASSLPPSLSTLYNTVVEKVLLYDQSTRTERKPLLWCKPVKIALEAKNPRFDIDYKLKRDNDTDEQRVKLKQLTREKKREEKAVMRELRRDSDFLEQEKFVERQKTLEKEREKRNKNYAWMEEQQATINQQVRKGGELLRGGGSGGVAKKQIKRKR